MRGEATVVVGWPASAVDEQVVELGRAAGPEDVGGLAIGDLRTEVAALLEAASVVSHPLEAGGVHFLEEGGEFGVSGGGVPRQQEDGGNPWADLGDEGPPGGEDATGVGLGVADRVGSLLGRYLARSGQAFLDDGPHQSGLAAETLVDRLDRYPCRRCDGRDGRGRVATGQEQVLGGVGDLVAGLAGPFPSACRVVAPFGVDGPRVCAADQRRLPAVIVIAGATGTLGARLVPRLTGHGLRVRVLTRDPARAHHLASGGVEVVRCDVRDRGGVTEALSGAGMVISGKILVFGRGDNPVNFVSATDVAALITHVATGASLRDRVLELGGPDDLTFNQLAAIVQEETRLCGSVRHIPRPVLRLMAMASAVPKPALARQARAALVMDTLDMTFDPAPARREFPDLPTTDIRSALKELLA